MLEGDKREGSEKVISENKVCKKRKKKKKRKEWHADERSQFGFRNFTLELLVCHPGGAVHQAGGHSGQEV